MTKQIKVFEMNDCDYFAGETAEDCIRAFEELFEYQYDEKEYPIELSEDDMKTKKFSHFDDDEKYSHTITFAERLQEMINEDAKFPCMFASTEY